MSIPLSQYYRHCSKIDDSQNDEEGRTSANSIFLDAEERYEVYEVKTAERSHLLDYDDDSSTTTETSESQDSSSDAENKPLEKPLIDGCDIRGWRKEKLVHCSSSLQAVLNVGASSTFFRRESQWPVFSNDLMEPKSPWYEMKTKLSDASNIRRKADVIHHDDCKQMVKFDAGDDFSEGDQARMATKFAIEYEQKNIPATILGATDGWKCMMGSNSDSNTKTTWTFANLLSRFGHVYWRFSDTHGEMMSFATYAKYISNLEGLLDDSPLGIYDSEFGDEDSPTHELLDEYVVPSCFSLDLFQLADEDNIRNERPPYRWILIGPERSGTGMHVDPLYTNAWVTILEGKKRWMLFPPTVPYEEIGMVEDLPQINSATWFKNYYEKVNSSDWPDEWRPVEVLQLPGETVFVPNGWPHLVLNLELTVAVTHNYASEYGPFERMWQEVKADEPDFSERWLRGMESTRPDLMKRLKNFL